MSRTRGERMIAFVERYLVVPQGMLVGRPVVLEDFQKRFLLDVYDNPAVTLEAILSIARKNAKTATIAMIVLGHTVGPEAVENSDIQSGAQSRDQAAQVYKYASQMALMSPEIKPLVHIIPSKKQIIGVRKNVTYTAMSAEAKTAHGGSPILAILDEVGQIEGETDDFVDAIETSQGAYENPLRIYISTQAPSDASFLSIKIDDARRSKDPKTVCHVYEAPKNCDIMDRSAWAAANPALGKFRSLKDVEEQAAKAARMPSLENRFRNLILNQRVHRHSPFVGPTLWAANGGEQRPIDGRVIHCGLDLSSTLDLTAFMMAAEDENGCVDWFLTAWTPEETIVDRAKRDRAPYETWVKQGFLRTTPGRSVNYGRVVGDIFELTKGHSMGGFAFDRWNMPAFEREMRRYEADHDVRLDWPMSPFGQGEKSMSPAIKAVETLLVNEKIRHGNNPLLTWCAANAVVNVSAAENKTLDKRKSTGRIDGLVAGVMATGLIASAEAPASPIDDFIMAPLSA